MGTALSAARPKAASVAGLRRMDQTPAGRRSVDRGGTQAIAEHQLVYAPGRLHGTFVSRRKSHHAGGTVWYFWPTRLHGREVDSPAGEASRRPVARSILCEQPSETSRDCAKSEIETSGEPRRLPRLKTIRSCDRACLRSKVLLLNWLPQHSAYIIRLLESRS